MGLEIPRRRRRRSRALFSKKKKKSFDALIGALPACVSCHCTVCQPWTHPFDLKLFLGMPSQALKLKPINIMDESVVVVDDETGGLSCSGGL